MKKTKTILLPLGILLGVLCVMIYVSGWYQPYRLKIALLALGVSLIVLFASMMMERKRARQTQQRMDDVFAENS